MAVVADVVVVVAVVVSVVASVVVVSVGGAQGIRLKGLWLRNFGAQGLER